MSTRKLVVKFPATTVNPPLGEPLAATSQGQVHGKRTCTLTGYSVTPTLTPVFSKWFPGDFGYGAMLWSRVVALGEVQFLEGTRTRV
eukprot:SAG11_NODE_3038_length_2742_cov_5.013243_3_plen_87_part_00